MKIKYRDWLVALVVLGLSVLLFECWNAAKPSPRQLHTFVRHGDVRSLQRALANGANPDAQIVDGDPPKIPGVTPLMLASEAGQVGCMHALLDAGANVAVANELGETALHYAAANPEAVELLLARGADPAQVTRNEATPLVYATRSGSIQSVELLLKSGVSIDTAFLAVTEAAKAGHPDILELLLQRTVQYDKLATETLSIALVLASGGECYQCVQLLLRHGAPVNSRGTFGETPLMRASESGSDDIVRFLRDSGADPSLADFMGQTVEDYQQRRRSRLRRRGTDLPP